MLGLDADIKMQSTVNEDLSTLIADARENPAAFGRLYDRYIQPVYRYLHSRMGDVHAAEDVTSQTFMAAYEALPKYRESGKFSAWLFRIARGKMNDYFRRNRHEASFDAAEELPEREDSLGILIRAEELSRIRFLVKNLKEEEQDLIRLRYVAELSFGEIAELLGKREDAVKKSVYRLLERLKGQMERP